MAENSGAVTKKTRNPKLTMEGYLDFIHSQKRLDLTQDHLNQIIYMHGFRKFQKTPKGILVEVLSKLELMDPCRSTIDDDGVTPDAILSIEDVIKDLNDLKWQECCITSLQTINAVSHHPQDGSLGISGGCSTGTVMSASSEKQPRKPRRKLKKISGLEVVEGSPKLDIGSSDKLPRTPVLENWSPRKKRTPGSRGGGVATPVSASEVQQLSSLAVALFLDSK